MNNILCFQNFLEISVEDLRKTYYKKQTEVIPALVSGTDNTNFKI